jgi:penicillin-insensitive murein endopeptidase
VALRTRGGRRAAGVCSLLILGCAAAFFAGEAALAKPLKNPWHEVKSPSTGAPRAIGDYSAGCVDGALALPLDGKGFHVVHPERRRFFGHPELVDFLKTLGANARAKGYGGILIADMGQPRGGPAPSGHSSHQSGLDVDIWYWSKDAMTDKAFPAATRKELKPVTVVTGKALNEQWSKETQEVLRMAASDARVTRIFVHPVIKRALCETVEGDRAWLGRLRPWYGHDDHYHVRLACPADSPDCQKQAPQPPGDGCAELDWWFDPAAQADREKGKKTYQSKVASRPALPAQCMALLVN